MSKYYLQSGSLEVCINAVNATEAAKFAILNHKPKSLGMLLKVSETGFNSTNPDDGFLLVPYLLHEMGFVDNPKEATQDILDSLYGDKDVN